MSSNLSNSEILNNLLEGRDLDELTSRSLMQRWLNDKISDVETGAFLSALRAKSSTGIYQIQIWSCYWQFANI